jgi:transcriptional regulator
VPTWNYIAVHLRGHLSALPADALRGHLDRLSETFETRLLPKPPWRADKMSSETLDRMMRMIVPCRFEILTVDGTWKLAQNKPDAARVAAADAMTAEGPGQAVETLAALMRSAGA